MKKERKRVERELTQIAFANAADYMEVLESPQEGRLVRLTPTTGMSQKKRAALAGIKEGKSGVEVKLKDALKALELLCKLNGHFGEAKQPPGEGSMEELLEGLKELDKPAATEEEEDDL